MFPKEIVIQTVKQTSKLESGLCKLFSHIGHMVERWAVFPVLRNVAAEGRDPPENIAYSYLHTFI